MESLVRDSPKTRDPSSWATNPGTHPEKQTLGHTLKNLKQEALAQTTTMLDVNFGVQGLRFRVQGLRLYGFGSIAQSLGFRVTGLQLRVYSLRL